MFDTSSKKFFHEAFVLKLLKYKPPNIHYRDYLDLIFCTESREIKRFKVKEEFCMPENRQVYLPEVFPTPSKKYAVIKKGKIIYVRTDKTKPNVVDVEAPIGNSRTYTWFKVRADEFERKVKPCLRAKKWRGMRRKQLSWERQ